METGTLSKRYAKAIYEYAEGKGEEERLLKDMNALANQFLQLSALNKVMENPTVDNQQKINLLVLASGEQPSSIYKQVVAVIVSNGRSNYAKTIALMYNNIFYKKKNIVRLQLTTASPINANIKQRLAELVADKMNKQLDFEEKTADIIGGFVLQVEDMRLDASIKSQLNRLKLELIQ
jgi:F-type H+-transporting ATPase subunit delta